jgi:hypothetical protein
MIPALLRDSACLSLSKSGSLATHASELRAVAPSQSTSEVVAFYSFLRDRAQRWESEWRSEFAAIFALSDDELPPVDDAERWASILHALVLQGDARAVRLFLEGIGVPRWDFSPVESEPGLDVYPIDTPDDSGELPVAKARRLGFVDIADYLERIREGVAARYRDRWRVAHAEKG